MFPVHHRPPEQMPPHQRDFPRRREPRESNARDGSQVLGLLVVVYVIAMLGGIGLLRILTAPVSYSAIERPLRN
jgi:hypothetical protein